MYGKVENSTVVGIFKDLIQEKQAMYELQSVGFSYDAVDLVTHDIEAGEADHIINELISRSIPEEEAYRYYDELKSGGILVIVNATDRYQEAFDILHHNGVYFAMGDPPPITLTPSRSPQTPQKKQASPSETPGQSDDPGTSARPQKQDPPQPKKKGRKNGAKERDCR